MFYFLFIFELPIMQVRQKMNLMLLINFSDQNNLTQEQLAKQIFVSH